MKALWTKKWLRYPFLGLLLVVGGVLAHPVWLPGVVASQASTALGRPVTVGEARLESWWPVRVVVGDVHAENLVRLRGAVVEADVSALLDGDLRFPEITVTGVEATLEIDDQGRITNLPIAPPSGDAGDGLAAGVSGPVVEAAVSLSDVRVDVSHPGGRHHLELGTCNLKASGRLPDVSATADFDLSVGGEGLSFELAGDVEATPGEFPRLDLTLKVDGDVDRAQALLTPLSGVLPFSLSGRTMADITLRSGNDRRLAVRVRLEAADIVGRREGFEALAFATEEPLLLEAEIPFEGLRPTGILLKEHSLKSPLASSRVSSVWVPLNILESKDPMRAALDLIRGQTSRAGVSARVGEALAWASLVTGRKPSLSLDALLQLTFEVDKGRLASHLKLDEAWMVTDQGRQAFTRPPELTIEASLEQNDGRQDLSVSRLDLDAGPLRGRFRAELRDLERLSSVTDPFDVGRQHVEGAFDFDAVEAGRLLGRELVGSARGDLVLDTRRDGGVLGLNINGTGLGTGQDGHRFTPELALKADYSRTGADLWNARIENLRLRETDLIDVRGTAELSGLDPADPAASAGRLDVSGALGGRNTMAARMPDLLPGALDFSPLSLRMVVARDKGRPWDLRLKVSGDNLSWKDERFSYGSPLTEADIKGTVHPDGRLEDGEVRVAWGDLVRADARVEGTADVWNSTFSARLDPNRVVGSMPAGFLPPEIVLGEMEPWSLNGRVAALSATDQDFALKVGGTLDLTRPEFVLREPFSLQAKGTRRGTVLRTETTRFVVGSAEAPVIDLRLDPVRHATDAAGLPALAGRLDVAGEKLEALFRPDFRKQLGQLKFAGPMGATFTYEAPNIAVEADLTRTTLKFGDHLDKDAGVPLSVALDTRRKTDNMKIAVADQVLAGTVDLDGGRIDVPAFDIDLSALGRISPVLRRQGFTGRLSGGVSGGADDLKGSLAIRQFRWRPFEGSALELKADGALEAAAAKDLTTLAVRGVDVGLGASQLRVTGDLTWRDARQGAALGITGPNLDIDEILAALPQVETVTTAPDPGARPGARPTAAERIDTKALARQLENRTFGFNWSVDRVLYKGIETVNSDVSLRLADQALVIDRFAAGLKDGRISGSARKSFVGAEDLSFNMTSKDVNLDVELIDKSAQAFWLFKLVRDVVYSVIPGVTGRLNGGFELTSRGLNPEDLLANAKGRGDFSFDDAKVVNPEWLKSLGQAMLGAAGPLSIKDPETAKRLTKYGRMLHDANFERARVRMTIDGNAITSKMELFGPRGAPGVTVFGRTVVDFDNIEKSPARFEVRLENLSDTDAKNWNTLVRGMFDKDHLPLGDRLDNLNIDFNAQSFIQGAIKEAVRRRLEEEAKKKLGEGVGDLLKGILGGD